MTIQRSIILLCATIFSSSSLLRAEETMDVVIERALSVAKGQYQSRFLQIMPFFER